MKNKQIRLEQPFYGFKSNLKWNFQLIFLVSIMNPPDFLIK